MNIPIYQPYDIAYYDKDGNKLEVVDVRFVPSKDKGKPSLCKGTKKVDWEKLTEYVCQLDAEKEKEREYYKLLTGLKFDDDFKAYALYLEEEYSILRQQFNCIDKQNRDLQKLVMTSEDFRRFK